MKANNKILAFLNIEEPIETIIESTINLAETFNADVNFFYAKKPTDNSKTENQLAFLRTKAQEEKAIIKLKNILARVQRRTSVGITKTITTGNVKKIIETEIQSYSPDMIVLGKRTPNKYRLLGKQITELVLKKFEGPVLIVSPSKVLEIKENLSLGVLDNVKSVAENDIASTLMKQSKEPIKRFKIEEESVTIQAADVLEANTIDYTFVNNENGLKSLTSYVHKNDVHLLCVERVEKKKFNNTVNVNEVLKRINTSMLMVGNTNNLITT